MLQIFRKNTITRNDEGASAVEYGLLVAAIAAAVAFVVFGLGTIITQVFSDTCETVQGESGAGSAADCNDS